jgi:enoyl-CoA hydratase/carnithine racemase
MAGQIRWYREGMVGRITLANPEKLNAIDYAMWRELAAIFATVTALPVSEAPRCLIVCGEGDQAFAAGGDIEEFLTRRDTLERALEYHEGAVAPALRAIASCPIPIIAEIHGACVGGGLEIACACDLRIAGRSARFGAPINRLGFSMYPGEMSILLRVMPSSVAAEILLEGRLLNADEAFAKGLLTRVVDDALVAGEATASAGRISAGAPGVARAHKRWLARMGQGKPLSTEEQNAAFAFLDSDDYREGLAAFFAKRPPQFSGN